MRNLLKDDADPLVQYSFSHRLKEEDAKCLANLCSRRAISLVRIIYEQPGRYCDLQKACLLAPSSSRI